MTRQHIGTPRTRLTAAVLGLVALAAMTVGAPAPAGAVPGYDFAAARTRITTATTGCTTVCGISISVLRRGSAAGTYDTLWRQGFGDTWPSRVVWTASAGKMITGITVMSVVDDGLISLDTTVGSMFPAYAGTPKGAITLRQLMSHTSGINKPTSCLLDAATTLAACADEALTLPLTFTPGSTFAYAGPPMQIAARMIEIATGKPFVDVFRDNVAIPLGLPTMHWASSTNPRVDGGLSPTGLLASAYDYERVLEMMLGQGTFRGQTVMSPATFASMIADKTVGTTKTGNLFPQSQGYGIGMWVVRKDAGGTTTAVASPGAFGSTPWVDLVRGYGGWWMTQGDGNKIQPVWFETAGLIDTAIDGAPIGTPAPLPPLPVITSLSVNRGPIAGAQKVTVTGTGLSTVTDAWFSASLRATSLKYISDTKLEIVSPPRAAGLVTVFTDSLTGRSAGGWNATYVYMNPPSISSLSPNRGSPSTTTAVTITGTELAGATAVRFGQANAVSFTVVSNTRIDAIAPAQPTGLVNVRVDAPGGTSATSSFTGFVYPTS